ncbi:hypothetical protein [Rhizobium alvei]|uniref:Uncharacterized protein n=1 Tax=Rhizobium alvei TaxID=1132659 RepID=A0ABT8YH54_9HYPH|nr:hypothetical protein [Rhizobium alvei]MDO6963013.1 hypothetical protein [Rhizobium alvei]
MRSVVTVKSLLTTLFPRGTAADPDSGIEKMPFLPTDVFAAAGLLVEQSHIYHKMKPIELSRRTDAAVEACEILITQCRLCCSEKDFSSLKELDEKQAQALILSGPDCWTKLGKLWKRHEQMHLVIQSFWNLIIAAADEPVIFVPVGGTESGHPWLRAALALLAISDEACEGLGFHSDNWIEGFFKQVSASSRADHDGLELIHADFANHYRQPLTDGTMCALADENVVCVMPKSRTPMIGCTMRTLSHNLALLPPPHKASAFWYRSEQQMKLNTRPLNLLLVPLPLDLQVRDFHPTEAAPSYDSDHDRWGEFSLHQSWLSDPDKVINDVRDLIKAAKSDGIEIEGLVFPEYSLNWKVYNSIIRMLQETSFSHVKFVVAGSSSRLLEDKQEEKGNFVLTTMLYDADAKQSDGLRKAFTSTRGKHHRWRLNRSQIESYDLDSRLDANTNWWEEISLTERKINCMVFRDSSVFSTLICEDLARSEPVHSVLQSLGPNLIFVLLMDGPQLPQRWAARNATGLAEDPGSSVLTFTSRGLLARQNRRAGNKYPDNHTIALWRDDTLETVNIDCPKDQKAVVLTLSPTRARETTLDGRSNADAWTWRMSGYRTLS